MRIKGYPLYWYLSSRNRIAFMKTESNVVYKSFPLGKHLTFLFYGLGNSLSRTVSWPMGTNYMVKFSELNVDQFLRFNIMFLRRKMEFGARLKRIEIRNYKRLFKIKCRRGYRLLRGLPVRGQRTHTNAYSAWDHALRRKKEVFSGKEALVGTRAQRKAKYISSLESKKALKLNKSRLKVLALLKEVKRKKKLKEKKYTHIMSKQKAQMERARKKWQAVAAKKQQQRMRKW